MDIIEGRTRPGGDVIDVRRFGAVGNGVADDAPAINAALDAARAASRYPAGSAPVYVPAGTYRLNRPLNLTGGQYNLVGDGMFQTVLVGNTGAGRCVVDMTGSTFSSVRDLSITTFPMQGLERLSVPSGSTYGVVWTRQATRQSAEMNRLERVHVFMHSDPRANGGQGTVALYNCACEVSSVRGCYLRADTALVLSGRNLTAFASTYIATMTGESSMTVFEVDRDTYLVGMAKACVAIHGGASYRIDAHLNSQAPRPYPYAVEAHGDVADLYLGGSVEACPYSLALFRGTVRGLRYHHNHAHGTPDRANLWLDGAEVLNSVIHPVPSAGNYATPGFLVDCAPGAPSKLVTSEIFAYGTQGLRSQNRSKEAQVTACRVFTDQPLDAFRIDFPTVCGNLVSSPSGISINGLRMWPC
jgi:hypothetical protein